MTIFDYVFFSVITIGILIFLVAMLIKWFCSRTTYGCIHVLVDEHGNYKDAALIPFISSEDLAKCKDGSYLEVKVHISKERKDY